MTALNPPPHWPEPPRDGWTPPEGWHPDRAWGAVPAGWRLWGGGPGETAGPAPLAESETIPASGVRTHAPVDEYPVEVSMPGVWTSRDEVVDIHGFPPAPVRRDRPGLRLTLRLLALVGGLLVAAATAYLFVRLVHFAQEDLPASALGTAVVVPFSPVAPDATDSTAPDPAS
ncbi:hypothetical protein GCM10027268_16890 [Brachybacterium huguangmaarense]